jgi:hypothetical protein
MMNLVRVFIVLTAIIISTQSSGGEANWLSLESGGIKIYKLYGLPEGERLTFNLIPRTAYDDRGALNWFYRTVENDLPRLGTVINYYQTELTKIPGLSVMTTMRRCRNQFGLKVLIYYQAFYIERQKTVWFVRTELNDDLNLLTKYYPEQLDLIIKIIGMKNGGKVS